MRKEKGCTYLAKVNWGTGAKMAERLASAAALPVPYYMCCTYFAPPVPIN